MESDEGTKLNEFEVPGNSHYQMEKKKEIIEEGVDCGFQMSRSLFSSYNNYLKSSISSKSSMDKPMIPFDADSDV
ncbi:hypothetical protein E3N88_31236 [Mikania micrantha]|uniref:Uncharacterized protein n=1 Tax=Mikania micrantha TaxID=192012 RepID=A0A5N6MPP1_9ASTR|nr:hypothetical protein E3N88_31236 [Mikania micrantha]